MEPGSIRAEWSTLLPVKASMAACFQDARLEVDMAVLPADQDPNPFWLTVSTLFPRSLFDGWCIHASRGVCVCARMCVFVGGGGRVLQVLHGIPVRRASFEPLLAV
jgi:hypothetical protein